MNNCKYCKNYESYKDDYFKIIKLIDKINFYRKKELEAMINNKLKFITILESEYWEMRRIKTENKLKNL